MGIFIFILIILAILVIANIKIVPQSEAWVIETVGSYSTTWTNGLHVKKPFIDKIAKRVSLKELVVDFPPQSVITKDNVTMQVDTVIFYNIINPKLFTYGVDNPLFAIENICITTLRNIIGDIELDATLTSRDTINKDITTILDEATDPWGIKINRVEVKNIMPPRDIQESMEKQMRAERERREKILQAEGEKKSAILIAEGERESAILRAQAEKEAAILKADAIKESKIRTAEGEAEYILKIQHANAEGIRMLNEACASSETLKLKSFETFAKVADGKATKIIIPSNIQDITSVAASLSEVVNQKDISNNVENDLNRTQQFVNKKQKLENEFLNK